MEMVRWPVSVASRHRRLDVSAGRNAGSLQRRCGRSRGFRRSWCGAAVRVCQTFSVSPEVFDDCSSVSRRLSLRERTVIREVNETVCALDVLETSRIVGSVSREKWF